MDITAALTGLAASPFVYVLLAAILIIDGFFPFVPGETAVIALATLGATNGNPQVWLIVIVAIVASTIGDNIAFFAGSRLGTTRFKWMRRPKVQKIFEWSARGLQRRPALFLIGAKFVPFARVAVTMSAGAVRLSYSRYLPLSVVASSFYTIYHVIVAIFAGAMFAGNPLLAVVVAVGSVAVLGALVEVIGRLRSARRARLRPAGIGPRARP